MNYEPSVELIQAPGNMLEVAYSACRTCYSALEPQKIYEEAQDDEKMLNLISKVLSSGHYSTIEHIQVTFAISNISRACSHQLVRHRHMSFSQKSQRYVKEKSEFEYVIPPSISRNPVLLKKYQEFMKKTHEFYTELTLNEIKAEDARFVLPNAAATSLVVSLNLRELIHFAHLRLCTRAQGEIRVLAQKMVDALTACHPWLSPYLAPKCTHLGYCDEDKSCGRMPLKP